MQESMTADWRRRAQDARVLATDPRLTPELRGELLALTDAIERLCDKVDEIPREFARIDAQTQSLDGRLRAHLAN